MYSQLVNYDSDVDEMKRFNRLNERFLSQRDLGIYPDEDVEDVEDVEDDEVGIFEENKDLGDVENQERFFNQRYVEGNENELRGVSLNPITTSSSLGQQSNISTIDLLGEDESF